MLKWRSEKGEKCKIYLGFTSNMVSCGIREIIRYLVEHKLVDYLCTTCGAIEEDIMKCYADTYLGKFVIDDKDLRMNGVNRIGNMLISNDNYCKFEDFFNPILEEML